MRATYRSRVAAFATALITALGLGVLTASPAAAAPGDEVRVSGTLHAGTPGEVVYEAIKPASWNGILVLDLDFNGWNAARRAFFLDRGYAIGGNQRTQNETAYEIKDYVDNLVTTRQLLIDAIAANGDEVAEPRLTIAWGNSRGAFVARMAAQYRPDVFDGALTAAGGGAGVLASWLSKADAVWALQELVNPDAGLAINDLPDIPAGASYGPTYEQDQKLNALVTEARATDAGMARLVLAAAFEQATDYPNDPKPAADDYLTQGQKIASGFAFGNPQFVHKEIEVMAGGPVVWNHGVDYAALLDASGARERVEWWYEHAGLDLEADLAKLAAAERYEADRDAIAVVEETGTYTGTGSPVMSIKTVGDSADPASLDEAYVRTFEAAGTADELLRSVYIDRPGHGGQSFGEMLAAFDVLLERIESGSWPATSASALNGRVAADYADPAVFGGGGVGKYIDDQPTPALRTWDFTNWGSYRAPSLATMTASATEVRAGQSITVRGEGFFSGETVQLWIESTPVLLGTAVAGADGVVSFQVAIPAEVGGGAHTLRLVGLTSGTQLTWALTVAAMPATGGTVSAEAVGGALALLVLGAGGVLLRRRRVAVS